jgi:hypothetical protein
VTLSLSWLIILVPPDFYLEDSKHGQDED